MQKAKKGQPRHPLEWPQDGVCNEPDCAWFKGRLDTEKEGEHCKLTKVSLSKTVGNCGANGEEGGYFG